GVADLPLAGQEHEDVARLLPRQFVEGVEDPLDLVLDRPLRGTAAGEVVPAVRGVSAVPGVCGVSGARTISTGPGAVLVVNGGGLGRGIQRTVADLDRIGPAGHGDDGRTAEVLAERLRIDRRGGDDDLEVR